LVALCEKGGVKQVATVTAVIDLGNDDGPFMARMFAVKEFGRRTARVRCRRRLTPLLVCRMVVRFAPPNWLTFSPIRARSGLRARRLTPPSRG
jgi:hypothetical protein